jgi:putative transposase
MHESSPFNRSISPHRPIHFYVDQECCWITAATLYHQRFFHDDARKRLWVEEFRAAGEAWRVELVAWTLMDHHYHAIARPEQGASLVRFLNRLHTQTSKEVNRLDGVQGRQVWRQYWDRALRTEGDFWNRINYIWRNPVRHGFCQEPEDWPWTNLHPLFRDPSESALAGLSRFPAPRKLPGDDW